MHGPRTSCSVLAALAATVATLAGQQQPQQSAGVIGENASAILSKQDYGNLSPALKEKMVLQLPQKDGTVRTYFDDLKLTDFKALSKFAPTTQGQRPRIYHPVSCTTCDESGLDEHRVPRVHNGGYGKPALNAPSFAAFSRPRIEGLNVKVAMIDQGWVFAEHIEFVDSTTKVSRVSPSAAQKISDEHATADAGTLGAAGVDPRARGSAPRANILSVVPPSDGKYWTAVEGILNLPISSHSTVAAAGWDGQNWWGLEGQVRDAEFGRYGDDAEAADALSARAPNHLMVVAAGNDRDDGQKLSVQPVEHRHRVRMDDGTIVWKKGSDTHPPDGADGGLGTVVGSCVGKNVVCVGAVTDIDVSGAAPYTLFTNFGPTNDGRVKPDVVANGFDVFALGVGQPYVNKLQGTSQAVPMVAGIVALIKEGFSKLRTVADPTAAELKAVLLHTASRPKLAPGPDPRFGWGLPDATAALDYLDDTDAVIKMIEVKAGESPKQTFDRDDDLPFRVTVVWTDPAQTQADAVKRALVSDVDATVKAPGTGGAVHFPWMLDRSVPHGARRAANHVDNVEIIDVDKGAIGTWTLNLNGANLVAGTKQVVAIALPGKTGS